LSAKEAGIIIIDNDNDNSGGKASTEDGEEDAPSLDFSAFDYWCR
jgi:hypothetical protein